MTTIMVPIDGSPFSEAALPVAAWLAQGLSAEIMLVMVGHVAETARQASGEEADLRATLHRSAECLEGLTVHERVGISNSPSEGIVELIEEERPDLVVMSTHGRSGWTEFVQGSVAEEVVRAGLVPVTLVRPPEAE